MVPALCEDARGAWETAASGTLHHGLWGVRVRPVPAIPTGTMALLGAAAGEGVERVVRAVAGPQTQHRFGDRLASLQRWNHGL